MIGNKIEKIKELEKNGYRYAINKDLESGIEYAVVEECLDDNKEKIIDLSDSQDGCSISYNDKLYPIKVIGSLAFYHKQIKEIVIPDTVEIIEYAAFILCSKLEKVHLPKELQSIEEYAFFDCRSINEISIPDNTLTIDKSAFAQCIGLKHINIPLNIKTIQEQVFCGCISLEIIDNIQRLASNDTNLGDYAFANCNNIRDNKAYSDLLIKLNEEVFSIPHFSEDD